MHVAAQTLEQFQFSFKQEVLRHYTSVNNRRKHNHENCTYLAGLQRFYKSKFASKESMIEAFHEMALPKETC